MSEDTWVIATGNIIVRTTSRLENLFDFYNGDGSGKTIKILSLRVMPRPARFAYAAGNFQLDVFKTSAKGTGGTFEFPVAHDSMQTALPDVITSRTDPQMAAAVIKGRLLASSMYHDENPVTEPIAHFMYRYLGEPQKPLTLHPGEGLLIQHGSAVNAGAQLAIEMIFTTS